MSPCIILGDALWHVYAVLLVTVCVVIAMVLRPLPPIPFTNSKRIILIDQTNRKLKEENLPWCLQDKGGKFSFQGTQVQKDQKYGKDSPPTFRLCY